MSRISEFRWLMKAAFGGASVAFVYHIDLGSILAPDIAKSANIAFAFAAFILGSYSAVLLGSLLAAYRPVRALILSGKYIEGCWYLHTEKISNGKNTLEEPALLIISHNHWNGEIKVEALRRDNRKRYYWTISEFVSIASDRAKIRYLNSFRIRGGQHDGKDGLSFGEFLHVDRGNPAELVTNAAIPGSPYSSTQHGYRIPAKKVRHFKNKYKHEWHHVLLECEKNSEIGRSTELEPPPCTP